MKGVDEIIEQTGALRRSDLDAWISEELISPRRHERALLFSDMECARIRLICTLRYELEIDAETLPVVLSLVDQLYETRQRLLSLAAAVAAQDKAVQTAILAAIDQDAGSGAAGEA
jgi:chaperone modulatory protein CbpM